MNKQQICMECKIIPFINLVDTPDNRKLFPQKWKLLHSVLVLLKYGIQPACWLEGCTLDIWYYCSYNCKKLCDLLHLVNTFASLLITLSRVIKTCSPISCHIKSCDSMQLSFAWGDSIWCLNEETMRNVFFQENSNCVNAFNMVLYLHAPHSPNTLYASSILFNLTDSHPQCQWLFKYRVQRLQAHSFR